MLFDNVLVAVGELGYYQIGLYVLLGLVGIPTGWQNLLTAFVAGNMDHWCHVPQLSNLSQDAQRDIAVPMETRQGEHRYSQCSMFKFNYSSFSQDDFLRWNRSTMVTNSTPVVSCPRGWVYDRSIFLSTVVSEMDLVCDRAWMQSLIQTIYMFGFLTGTITFGQISDKIGRYITLFVSLSLESVLALGTAFVTNYPAFVLLRYFVGCCAAGAFTTIFVMCMEIIGPHYRMKTGIFVQGWFALGFMTLPGIAMLLRDHRSLQICLACLTATLVLTAFLVPESPRWLVAEGRDRKAIKILKRMAKINRRSLPQDMRLEENRAKTDSEGPVNYNLFDLLKTPNLRKNTIIMWITWFTSCIVYYGLSFGVGNMGNLYFNSFITGLVEIPAYIMTIIVLDRFGRRMVTIVTLLLGGIVCLVSIALVNKPLLSMIGKFFSSATFAIAYVYAAELFPTVVRNVGVGSSSMCARVGGLLQPQISRLSVMWSPAQYLVYGGVSVISGGLCYMLPETANKNLPETIAEGELFGRKLTKSQRKGFKDLVTLESSGGEEKPVERNGAAPLITDHC